MVQFSPRPAAIAIDFGTSHTIASIGRADGRVSQLLFDGSPQLPSAVSIGVDGSLHVGVDAIHDGQRRPEWFEPHPKRRVDEETVLLGDREVPVQSLIAAVLGRVKREIDQTTGAIGPVTLTVPADWGPTRRHVLIDAANAAGFGSVTTAPEPVAAAEYFVTALGSEVPVGSGVVVYDLGGGTFDASVLRRGPRGFEVLAVDGADDLGGVDFDQALAEHLATTVRPEDERWRALDSPESTSDRRHRGAWLVEVRRAKERLSRQTSADLTVPVLDLDAHLTREELERVVRPLVQRTVRIAQGVVRESGLGADQIAGLFLVGAASRMPLVATLLHQGLGIVPAAIEQPELAVSEGALGAAAIEPLAVPGMSPVSPTQAMGYPATAMLPPAPAPVPTLQYPLPHAVPARRSFGSWLKTTAGMLTAAGVAVAVVAASVVLALNLNDAASGSEDEDTPGTGSSSGEVDEAAKGGAAEMPVDPAVFFEETFGTFEPVTETGSGSSIVDIPEGVAAGLVEIDYRGGSTFSLTGLDDDNKQAFDIYLTSFDSFKGTAAFGLSPVQSSTRLKIETNGEWTVTLKPVGDAPELVDAESGESHQVLQYNREASDWDVECDSEISCTITQYTDDDYTGVSYWLQGQIGANSGTTAGRAGPSIVVIASDGEWSLTKQ